VNYASQTYESKKINRRESDYTPQLSLQEVTAAIKKQGGIHNWNVMLVGGDIKDGEYGGDQHVALDISILKSSAENPEFIKTIKEYKAIKPAFAPIIERLGKTRS